MSFEEGTSASNSSADCQYVVEQKVENKLDSSENGIALEVGMCFDSLDALFLYYKQYGKQEGFGVKKKASRNSPCGKLKHVTLSCCRARKSKITKQNSLNPKPPTKIDCKARINATMWESGKCKINSIVFEHNHALVPPKLQFAPCNKETSIGAQRMFDHNNASSSRKLQFSSCSKETSTGAQSKLELTSEAGISITKDFQPFVIEAGGYDKVLLLEKDCRNYVETKRYDRLQKKFNEAASWAVASDEKCEMLWNECRNYVETKRYEKLQKKFDEAAKWAVVSDEHCEMLWNTIDVFQSKINAFQPNLKSNGSHDPSKLPSEINIRSPVAVQRLPQEREIPKVENALAKRKRQNKETKEKGETILTLSIDQNTLDDETNAEPVASFVPTDLGAQENTRVEDSNNHTTPTLNI